jgi:hypothetical protein
MKRLFLSAFAALALFATIVPMNSAAASPPLDTAYTAANHSTEKIVAPGYVIASTAEHDVAVPMHYTIAKTSGPVMTAAALHLAQMKRGHLARVYAVPWRS